MHRHTRLLFKLERFAGRAPVSDFLFLFLLRIIAAGILFLGWIILFRSEPVDVEDTGDVGSSIHGVDLLAVALADRDACGADESAAAETVLGREDAHLAEAKVVVVVFILGVIVLVVGAGKAFYIVPGQAKGRLGRFGFRLVEVSVDADPDFLEHVWTTVARCIASRRGRYCIGETGGDEG